MEAQIGQFGCARCSALLTVRVALDEYGHHAQAASELDVGERVADHDTGSGVDLREVLLCLFVQPRQGLAALALILIVRTEVEGVYVCTMRPEQVVKASVEGFHVRGCVETKSDAALVGDDDNLQSGAIESREGPGYSGQDVEISPGGYVASLRHFLVQNAVTIEENCVQLAA